VEVYQADFNAEREARQKIAGEKSDLLDELHRLKREQNGGDVRIEEVENPRRQQQPRGAVETPRLLPTTNFVRETANQVLQKKYFFGTKLFDLIFIVSVCRDGPTPE